MLKNILIFFFTSPYVFRRTRQMLKNILIFFFISPHVKRAIPSMCALLSNENRTPQKDSFPITFASRMLRTLNACKTTEPTILLSHRLNAMLNNDVGILDFFHGSLDHKRVSHIHLQQNYRKSTILDRKRKTVDQRKTTVFFF